MQNSSHVPPLHWANSLGISPFCGGQESGKLFCSFFSEGSFSAFFFCSCHFSACFTLSQTPLFSFYSHLCRITPVGCSHSCPCQAHKRKSRWSWWLSSQHLKSVIAALAADVSISRNTRITTSSRRGSRFLESGPTGAHTWYVALVHQCWGKAHRVTLVALLTLRA